MNKQKQNPSQFSVKDLINTPCQVRGRTAFTLVELIVVITILAILGTIAFISLQGYSAQSRDSARISDLSTMRTSLELFQLDAGKYPLPTDGVDVTYSGGVVWTQGTFGESVFKNVEKLDKIPDDPLTSTKYTYSITALKNEYELSGVLETELTLNILDETYAGDTQAIAIVTGNFNGQTVKSFTGVSTCNMLATPTIITNDLSVTDLPTISTNENFVYNGFNNLPSSYKNSRFKHNGGFDFSPVKLLAYTDNGGCSDLTSKTINTARVTLIKGLQEAYTGTLLKNVGKIKRILSLGAITDVNNPSNEVINFSNSYVNNNLGGEVPLTDGGTENVVTYTVTFDSQGGSAVSGVVKNDGETIGTLTTPTRSGYSFDGWFTLSSGGTQITTSTVVGEDIIYYAQWTLTCSCSYTQTAYQDNICSNPASGFGYNGVQNATDNVTCQTINGHGASCIDTGYISHLVPYTQYTGYSDNGACN